MTIQINFIPSFIGYFVKAKRVDGSYFGAVIYEAWGDTTVFDTCRQFFMDKIESADLERGMLLIQKSTLKYEILDINISDDG